MFPDIRLMIVAVAVSVVVLSCGFGVFAALRVNHEPLSRLPSATAPLQLVPENLAPPTVLSGGPSPGTEPEIAAAAIADEPARESARNDGGESPSSAPSVAEPEALAFAAEEKTQAAAPPADPPPTSANVLAADDHPAGVTEAEPVQPVSADGGNAPNAQGETASAPAEAAVAAGGEKTKDEAKADKPADTTGEPAPVATPNVAALQGSPASETAAAEQTTPAEQRVAADETAPIDQRTAATIEQRTAAEQTAPSDQSTRADQSAPAEQTAPVAPKALPTELARLNLEDDAADAADATSTPIKKAAHKKHSKTRVAAKASRRHRTRVARFNPPDGMFGQPHFASAPQAFQSAPRRTHHAAAKKTPHTNSAVGGPLVTMPSH